MNTTCTRPVCTAVNGNECACTADRYRVKVEEQMKDAISFGMGIGRHTTKTLSEAWEEYREYHMKDWTSGRGNQT